ncbi:uncharacterized protein IUM83_18745 [Phytophthora cinnamomi]|uniref:uncharacterized protein n=1 Tax=Phytophthora cinnamomi TaxID=4785 RepID=UPI00355A3A51|nr:hypothetical protein IUM83_18745 [Phytophthora cinnamomi]
MAGTGRSVATWEWRRGNRQHLDGDSYLVSTGNVMPYLAEDEKSEKLTIELDGDIDELLLVEEEILAEDVTKSRPPSSPKTSKLL